VVRETYTSFPPTAAAFDTETDGLHLTRCKPFLFQFGWWHEPTDTIYAYAIDLEHTEDAKEMIAQWYALTTSAPVVLGANVKYDMHMMDNIGMPVPTHNLSDVQFYIRFAHDNVSARQGGVLLGIKDYCSKYIDPSAKTHDKAIQVQRAQIAKEWNVKLSKTLGWSMGKIDEFFKDPVNDTLDMPNAAVMLGYIRWKASLPNGIHHVWGKLSTDDIPYNLVNRDLVIDYGMDDIVWTLRIFKNCQPTILQREAQLGLDIENKLLVPLYSMERQGLPIDKDYVTDCYYNMRTYVKQRRALLTHLIGRPIKTGQHKELAKWYVTQGVYLDSTGNDILNNVLRDYRDNELVIRVTKLIQELRTLEKWFSTYLMRFRNETKIYTQINQVGAASLRMSSDFQQFPKKGLKTYDGRDLFNPRRAIVTSENPMVYLDYSQIELRVQALYTIIVGHPDLNLCRAYMPYKCKSDIGLFEFDYTNKEHRKNWNSGEWVQLEDGKHWEPTDVHGATTKAAFNIDESDPRFSELRSLGKRVNFAKNYGAQQGKIAEMFPEYPESIIRAIDQGYYRAFPGIRYYQDYCYQIGNYQFHATNLFGIRYWNVNGHNLINMLIQGGSATLIKLKIIELYEFLKPYKTKMVLPVHDEVQFDMPKEEFHLIPKLQAIMEDWDDCYIPIVADVEVTYTNWSDKESLCVSSE
jgi:DNA polymerase-1